MIKIGTDIKYAKTQLDDGGLVAIPTETVYGLGGNALNSKTIEKIFSLKNRPNNDPLICHTYSIDQVEKYVKNIPKTAYKLAEKFWPGPLTLIFEKENIIPDITTANLSTVGFRIPKKKITLDLFMNLEYPIAAPSANKFGYISPTKTDHILNNFNSGINYILDGGNCELGIESTIIGFKKDKTIIYRLGSLIYEDVMQCIGEIKIYSDSEVYPGSFINHYAPDKKLYVGDIETLYHKFKDKRIGILCYDRYYDYISKENQIILSKNSSLNEASRNLYSSLYKFDNMKSIDIIITSFFIDKMMGKTMNNRLKKSSEKE
tara:strand:- start:884 stop:1837 length:954 start_codon:yes stop_codon:yes gene_type:complete